MATSSQNPPIEPKTPYGTAISSIADPRERLLAAGLYVVTQSDLAMLVNGIQPETVAAAAGRSRRNFYDHFESKEDFMVALFERYLLDEDLVLGVSDITDTAEPDPGDFRANVASWFSKGVLDSAEIFTLLSAMVWPAARNNSELADIVRRHNDMFERIYSARYEVTLAEWNIELVEGWSPLRLAAAVRAFLDGYILRYRPSMGDLNETRTNQLIEAIVGIFAAASANGTSEGLGGAAFARKVERRWREVNPAGVDEVLDLRRVLQDVLVAELQRMPPETVTIEYIAERAGVSAVAVRREVGSTFQLCTRVFNDSVTLIEGALLDDLDDLARRSESITAVVQSHLVRVERFGTEHSKLLRCWFALRGSEAISQNPVERLITALANVLDDYPGRALTGHDPMSANDAARLMTLPLLMPQPTSAPGLSAGNSFVSWCIEEPPT